MDIRAIGNQNQLFHVSRINQSAARINKTGGVMQRQRQEQDRLALTPQGKKQSLLENLMKQKQSIMERKGELRADTAEKGGSVSDIQSQLDLMDEQLKNIDEQIAKARSETLEPEKEDKEGKIYEKPKTAEEAKSEALADITRMASDLDTAEVAASVKSKLDGEINVLKNEVETGIGNIEKKLEKIGDLEARADEILEKAGTYLKEEEDEELKQK